MESFHPDALIPEAQRIAPAGPRLFAQPRPWTAPRRAAVPVGAARVPAREPEGPAGLRARFLRRHPGGFADPLFRLTERAGRLEARRRLLRAVSPAAAEAGAGDPVAALAALEAARLLGPEDAEAATRLLRGRRARAFLAAAARFAAGGTAAGLTAMRAAAAPDAAGRWPVLTAIPFLWRPDAHMLLDPGPAGEAARHLDHPLAGRLAAGGPAETYRALLQLCAELRASVADLAPTDNLDLLGLLRAAARPG
ncbi:MAG TPA: hypothetical protein VJ994_08075 [Paracoccaceae bacterium]|nr:hypothetical protein [Paracoccaceae bacterium]